MKRKIVALGLIGFLLLVFIIGVNFYVVAFSNDKYHTHVDQLQDGYVGLVFGASVLNKQTPSDILKDRLDVAIDAYVKNKIEKIIVSGDNSVKNYNEPVVMQKYLMEQGVDVDDIYLDYAGFDTYDSLYRAREIFGVREVTLFTQDFHLKRALYIAKRLGIDAQGVETNLSKYVHQDYNNRREVFARIKAFIETEILKSKPTYLGDKIQIITDEKINEAKKEILEK